MSLFFVGKAALGGLAHWAEIPEIPSNSPKLQAPWSESGCGANYMIKKGLNGFVGKGPKWKSGDVEIIVSDNYFLSI
jgi:hypothetical protein